MANPNLKPGLIIAIGRGEKRALEKLYREWKDKIFHYIYFKTGDPEGAKEILQEVFLAIWKSAPSYRNEAAPLTWIFSLVKRKVADFFREKEKEQKIINSSRDYFLVGVGEKNQQNYSDLFSGLKKLEPQAREALFLVYYMGFTYQEAAKQMEIPVGTLKSKLFYGKKKLKEDLD